MSAEAKAKGFFSMRTSKEWVDRFREYHIKFLTQPKIDQKKFLYQKVFFSMLIQEMVEDLKSKEKYFEAQENFINVLTRRGGGREKGQRYVEPKDLATFQLGYFPEGDNTYELFYNVTFSLAKNEDMQNINQYSASYFFLDVVLFLEKNFNSLVRKYKK